MLQALLQSRKVWITIVGVVMVVVNHYGWLTPAESIQVTALLGALGFGIAIEGKPAQTIAAGGDIALPPSPADTGKDPKS